MSDLMLFWWIATFLVVSPIASRYLIKRFRADGLAWCGIALSGYVVFTLYLNRVTASDRAAFLMVAACRICEISCGDSSTCDAP